jgi:hypothetical protein
MTFITSSFWIQSRKETEGKRTATKYYYYYYYFIDEEA